MKGNSMKRSVYSLVLMDDVVRKIDQAAYTMNTSRSNLINQILAEYVSCPTPEQRTRDIFDQISQMVSGQRTLQIQGTPSDGMLSIRSALPFRYNPTIRYAVEIYRGDGDIFGELRVSSRTQSRQLLGYLNDFFTRFAHMELRERQLSSEVLEYRIEGGRFTRKFTLPQNARRLTNQQIGSAVAWYIQMFDKVIETYFDSVSRDYPPEEEIKKQYLEYLKNTDWLI